jgi:peptide-methionine (S)-S-oxide reductase
MAQAVFAAGCFWGIEAVFRQVKGVAATAVGYTGGATPNPSYEAVCAGQTGHAEAVRVDYDPDLVGYDDLLQIFWGCHDPTQLNRQGPDLGTQYRTAIFCLDAAQETAARASMDAAQASGRFRAAIVTEIGPAAEFHMAEDYHQQYIEKQTTGRRRWF